MATRSDLRTLLRDLIDEPNPVFWSDARLNRSINASLQQLAGEITERGSDYYVKRDATSITTVASTAYVALPTDFVRLRRIYNSDGEYLTPRQFKLLDPDDTDEPMYFEIINDNIYFQPIPDAVYVLPIEYWYKPADMSSDSDTPDFPAAYHNLLAWDAAVTSILQDSNESRGLQRKYEQMKQTMLSALMTRQSYDVPHVQHGSNDYGPQDV